MILHVMHRRRLIRRDARRGGRWLHRRHRRALVRVRRGRRRRRRRLVHHLSRGRVYRHSSYAHIVDHPGRVSARIHGSSEVHHPRRRPFWSLRVRLNLNLRSSALLNELDVFAGSTDDHANLGVRNRHRRRRRRESRPGGRAFTPRRASVKLGRRLAVPRVDVLGELGAFLAKKRRYQLRPAHALKQRPDRALAVARAIV